MLRPGINNNNETEICAKIIYTGVKFNPRLLKVSFIVWKKQQNLSTHQTIQVHKDIYQNLTRQGSPFYW